MVYFLKICPARGFEYILFLCNKGQKTIESEPRVIILLRHLLAHFLCPTSLQKVGGNIMVFPKLSEQEERNLDRMNRNMVRFAYLDAANSDDPDAIANWLRISAAARSNDLYSPEAFIRLP